MPIIGRPAAARRRTAVVATLTALTLGLASCGDGGNGDGDPGDDETVRIGVTNQDETNQEFAELAREELGIDVEIVNFGDFNQPNPALANGDLDANWFQHIAYLADYNVNNDDDLTMVATTEAVPLPLYSEEYDEVEDLQDGDTVAIPNDEINQARAILMLASADLLELTEDVPQPRPADIDEGASLIEVEPIDAAQTVNALQSVEGAVINNSFANDAGLNPQEDALTQDDPEDAEAFPYSNGFVVRSEDAEDERLLELFELYHDERILESAQEVSGDTSVPVDASSEEIRDASEEYEDFLSGEDDR
ncbi:MetQ/NlpA family ABC transporter substrate-binding protein [Nesterenkonia marinintestina]|uniref:MetQ/NlpA family ABC transporter substrate-binding protein n=1 Tax=Nesterenkonia marinintestina TaxID=2979865 RepID=UPI0021C0719F|nr:MetQ/NlpA family ABC transporter substrate-binding protein [Nesterenkonia sp. GX14115]